MLVARPKPVVSTMAPVSGGTTSGFGSTVSRLAVVPCWADSRSGGWSRPVGPIGTPVRPDIIPDIGRQDPNREEVNALVVYTQILVSQLTESLRAALRSDRIPARGQGLAEYALILALIAIIAIVALLFLGGQISKILSTVGKSV